jgi:hypothetical protein
MIKIISFCFQIRNFLVSVYEHSSKPREILHFKPNYGSLLFGWRSQPALMEPGTQKKNHAVTIIAYATFDARTQEVGEPPNHGRIFFIAALSLWQKFTQSKPLSE